MSSKITFEFMGERHEIEVGYSQNGSDRLVYDVAEMVSAMLARSIIEMRRGRGEPEGTGRLTLSFQERDAIDRFARALKSVRYFESLNKS